MKKASYESQPLCSLPTKALLIVLSGPSGAGKDALLARMKESGYPLEYITTVTTRAQRPGEQDNVDYHFTSAEKFQEMVKNNELLEWANVYGNWYGVPKKPVKQALEQGKDTIVKVDTQGVATIKKILPEAIFILVVPPSKEELVTRLKERRTESPPDLSLRIKAVGAEIKQLPLFDYIVVNRQDKVDMAISDVKAIITAEKCRVSAREIAL
jgi:guanylate kinase